MESSDQKTIQTITAILSSLHKEREIEIFPLMQTPIFINDDDIFCSKQQLFELFFRLDLLKLNKNNMVQVKNEFETLKNMLPFNIEIYKKRRKKSPLQSHSISQIRIRRYSIIVSPFKENQNQSTYEPYAIDNTFMEELSNCYNDRVSSSINKLKNVTTDNTNNSSNNIVSMPITARKPIQHGVKNLSF